METRPQMSSCLTQHGLAQLTGPPFENFVEISLIFFTSKRRALHRYVLKFMPGPSLEIFAARVSTLVLYENGQVGDRSCQIGIYSNTKQGSITCFLGDMLVCDYTHVFRLRSPFPRVSTRMCQTFGTGSFEAYIRRYFQSPIWPIMGQSSEL